MSEITIARPSRRRLLGAGTAGAGAALLGAMDVRAALALGTDPATGVANAAGAVPTGGTSAGFPPAAALPPVIPGTRTTVAGLTETWTRGAAADLRFEANGAVSGVYASNGAVFVPLDVPPGSFLQRVDVYLFRELTGTMSMNLIREDTQIGDVSLVSAITTNSGTGVLTGAFTTPVGLGQADFLYLYGSGFTSNQYMFCGAVSTYYDQVPQLFLHPSPIRVYDSRPGNAPLLGTKAPLANGAARSVNMAYGGAVPIGARAALVSVTIVNTSPAGFLALYRGGIAWPGNSSVNWDHANQVSATTTVSAVNASSIMNVYANTGCSTDFLVDVIGYYA